MQAPSGRTFSRLGVIRLGECMMPGEPVLSDSERAVWIGEGRAAHYRQKAAHFKELASVELQPRAVLSCSDLPRNTTNLPRRGYQNRAVVHP